MPIITQADVLAKIILHRERGVYKAAVPSTEILAYKYRASLPSPTDTFSSIIDELQEETRNFFPSKHQTPFNHLPPIHLVIVMGDGLNTFLQPRHGIRWLRLISPINKRRQILPTYL